MKCLDCGKADYIQLDGLWGGNWTCDSCSNELSTAAYEKIEAMQAVIDLATTAIDAAKYFVHCIAEHVQGAPSERFDHASNAYLAAVVSWDFMVIAKHEPTNCTGSQPCGHNGCKRCEGADDES
jgi:hypothetical protein